VALVQAKAVDASRAFNRLCGRELHLKQCPRALCKLNKATFDFTIGREMLHRRLYVSAVLLSLATIASIAPAAEPEVRHGEVRFEPAAEESHAVPERFRLEAATFAFEQTPQPNWQGDVQVSLVTFPSPVNTPHENNNTVHCEYFRPAKPGKYPACVVLHILGGDFPLARLFAYNLAEHGVAALFVKMPYYGERRQPGVSVRMISTDPAQTVAGMTQAVKDIRYAAAWLSAQEEVDASQLGIFGISLGGITATLAAEAEPRFTKCCPVLAGGDLNRILCDSEEKHLVEARQRWLAGGHSLAELVDLMKSIDPCTYGDRLRDRKVLMLNAEHDEVIPRVCTDSLCEALGKPQIFWYDAGHFSAMLHIGDALDRVAAFFGPASSEN
jgi:dienelactone hydrolase